MMGAASLLGDAAALRALKTGEQFGVNQYEQALVDDRVSMECKDLIRQVLLPRQREHIQAIDRVIAIV